MHQDAPRDAFAGALAAVVAVAARGCSDQQLASCPTLGGLRGRSALPGAGPLEVRAEDLGPVYESALGSDDRKARGVWFTPSALVTRLVSEAAGIRGLDGLTTILDPACGGGAFLIGGARTLVDRGVAPGSVFQMLHGWDIDPDVLVVARVSLELLAIEFGVDPALAGEATLVNADFLASGVDQMDLLADPPAAKPEADLIVGNPPFLTPLRVETARSATDRARLKSVSGASAHRWVDSSVLFLQQAVGCLRTNGVCALVLPLSIVATRDAMHARTDVTTRTAMRGFWIDPNLEAFPGSTAVCAPILELGSPPAGSIEVPRWCGLAFEPLPLASLPSPAENWASLAVDETSLPVLASPLRAERTVADVAMVAADFRDQFYALAEVAQEFGQTCNDAFPIVVTGAVDPARLLWGEHESRLNRVVWTRPAVTRDALQAHPVLAGWADARLHPKILIASQTRVVEAVVDEAGTWLPCTPLISVIPTTIDLWALAAIIGSPVAARWARMQSTGAARSAEAIKLSAGQLRQLPVPDDSTTLRAAGEAFYEAQHAADRPTYFSSLVESARLACAAYGLGPDEIAEMVGWWIGRLPRRAREVSEVGD